MHVEDKSKPRHLLMVEDINDRKMAEEEREKLQAQRQLPTRLPPTYD